MVSPLTKTIYYILLVIYKIGDLLPEDFEIEQTWWHIEDQLNPSKLRIIRQVMDVYTNKDYLKIELSENHEDRIFGLQVNARNRNLELAFIVKDNYLFINLGGNELWPKEISTNNSQSAKRKHVKFELKYIERYKEEDDGLIRVKWNGYKGYLLINSYIRPEFIISVPMGMKIKDKGKDLDIIIYQMTDSEKVYATKLKLIDPMITDKNGKNTYTYAIDDNKDQDLILKAPIDWQMAVSGKYNVIHDFKFWAVPGFGAILMYLSFVEFLRIIFNNGNIVLGTPEISIVISLFSFSAIVLTLYKEKYEIPVHRFVNFSVIFTTAILIILLFIYLYSMLGIETSLIVTILLIIFGILMIFGLRK